MAAPAQQAQAMQAQQMAAYQAYMQQVAAAQQQAQAQQAGGAAQAQPAQGQATAAQQQQMAAYQQQLAAYQQAQQQAQQQQQMGGAQAQQAAAQQAAAQQQQAAAQQAAQAQAVQAQRMAQQQQAAQAQAAQGGQQAAAAAGGKYEPRLEVGGCAHATVGPIIRGSFVLAGENHGKPTYKKDVQVNGLDVMIYFWDDRDGVGFGGWWFGPKVGGDQVWAYHADKVSVGPPQGGWKVPYDGPVDASMAVTPKAAQAAQPAQHQQQQQAMMQQQLAAAQQQQQGKGGWNQQAQQQQQGGWNQQAQKGGGGGGGQGQQEQARLQQQRAQLEQLKLRQQEEQKKRLEENRAKLEEANVARMAQQQAKMEEMKKAQEELVRRRQEEMEKRQAQVAQQRAEQEAVLKIRRQMQKFKASSNEKFEEYKVEFDEIMKTELEACGSQKERIMAECEQAIEDTKKRMVQMEEQKKLDEEKKAAENVRRQELKAKAEELLVDLGKLIEDVESHGKAVTDEADAMSGDKLNKADEIIACAKAVDGAVEEANKKMTLCSEFVIRETANIRDIPPVEGAEPSTCPADLAKLLGRLQEVKKTVTATAGSIVTTKHTKLKKAAAQTEVDKHMVIFKKYAKAEKLSRKEIQNYAKGEFNFAISQASLDQICTALVEDGSKGVPKDEFHRVRAAVGIARELVADGKLKEQREQKEKELVKAREALQAKVDDAKKVVEATEAVIQKVEKQVSPAETAKTAALVASEMMTACDEIDNAVTEVKDSFAGAKDKVAGLNEDVDAHLKDYLALEVRRLEQHTKFFDSRVQKIAANAAKVRADAQKKTATELEELRNKVVDIIQHHQVEKALDNTAMFKAVAKDDKITGGEFVKFVKSCENKDAENGAKEVPSDDDLSRAFEYIAEDEGHLNEEQFVSLVRAFMKVAKATVLTEEIDVKSTTVRRLDAGELVEVIQQPKKEESSIARAQVKALSDGVVGWVAIMGDQGTVYLEKERLVFKVVKETILTGSFDIGGDKDETRKLKDTTRKLKVGEIVDVREAAKKEETSGVMRMKVRVKSDGHIGWATSVGNTGIVFLEVV